METKLENNQNAHKRHSNVRKTYITIRLKCGKNL